jgi:hypothetical protein
VRVVISRMFFLLFTCCDCVAHTHTHTHCSAPSPPRFPSTPASTLCAPPAMAHKSAPLFLPPSSLPPSRGFPPPHSFLCLLSFLPCYTISLTVFPPFCGGSLGFPVKQTKIVNIFGIQKVEQDTQAAKCRLSQGNSFLPPACTIAYNLIMSSEM